MKRKMDIQWGSKLTGFLKQYKYMLVLLIAGVVLLVIPTKKSGEKIQNTQGATGFEEDFSISALEEELSEILSGIEGAGKVSVMLTVQSGMERILATNRDLSEQNGERELQEEIVIISGDSGDEAVLISQNYPVFQGALVVCQGGDDPEVQLMLIRALSALTGLGTNRIMVCKGS